MGPPWPDTTSKGGFTIAKQRQAVVLTGPSFVGKHTVTVYLSAGQWMFYPSTGTKHHFVVAA